jgi:bifunctional enzyme CysN/CysC
MTCGSVDDGKSTLIGRLLYDCRRVFDDQLRALERDSKQYGTQGDALDFALLVDGLQAEREQGITIDVAYRYFSSDARAFIVADTPGHEQYTRNMATAASTAELAVLLVDARKGILTQTRRHTRIVSMFGVQQIILAVNKIDLVGYAESTFNEIAAAYRTFAQQCGVQDVTCIPTCAVSGENVAIRGSELSWFRGPTLLTALEQARPSREPGHSDFRLPVQWVNRPSQDFRGYCGRVASGRISAGDAVKILPSAATTRIKDVIGPDPSTASVGESVTVTFADEIDVSRGDLICQESSPAEVADQFEARLLWMGDRELVPGRFHILKLHAKEVPATITDIKYREDVNTGAHLAAHTLGLNEIAVVNLSTAQMVAFEPYRANRTLGAFILIDKLTLATVGGGMINFALRRSTNIQWQALDVDRRARAELKHQQPRCVWFTGLSGSGKSTIANLVERKLHAEGRHTYLLDGDNVRHGLSRDLGFTEADRVENIRRVAEVAKLMADAGLIVLVSLISPFRSERQMARDLFAPGDFIEVFVDTPLQECERRDPKGLYAKARAGLLKNFTGIDSAYEEPEAPELRVDTMKLRAEECADVICSRIR